MKRRHFMASVPFAALLPLPAVASEHPNDKVRRLGREIMQTLRDPAFIGFNRITITPEFVGYAGDEPETRIAYAIGEIRAAIAEDHPDWRFQMEDRSIGVINSDGTPSEAPRRRGIVLYASDERFGPEQARLYVDYR